MMNAFENPIQFDVKKEFNGIVINYFKLAEISQGGPEVGNISINGQDNLHYRFGGPLLIKDGYIYIPIYVKKFCVSGFRLAEINANNLNMRIIGKIKDLIFLDKIERNQIYFFENLDKTIRSHYDLK